jgi:uncharacterized protein
MLVIRNRYLAAASALYLLFLAAFWAIAEHFSLSTRIGHMPSAFAAFALIMAPYWFFGFGLAEILQQVLKTRAARVLTPGLLVVPYLVYSLPRDEFSSIFFVAYIFLPVSTSALFEFLPPQGSSTSAARLSWQDVLALAAVALPIEFHWLDRSFPHPGLSSLPKLLLLDSVLYAFLVVRRLDHVGYDFGPQARDFVIGIRELLFFAPIVISLGLALHFITPHKALPSGTSALSALAITFFFIAIPEELFFRGLLQNLLESRLGRTGALSTSAVIFGLSHFNKPLPFNWKYVLLATIAGIFYGRAWRSRRRLLASATTHTLVDVLWSLWFR